jgi:hypothetical protein
MTNTLAYSSAAASTEIRKVLLNLSQVGAVVAAIASVDLDQQVGVVGAVQGQLQK